MSRGRSSVVPLVVSDVGGSGQSSKQPHLDTGPAASRRSFCWFNRKIERETETETETETESETETETETERF